MPPYDWTEGKPREQCLRLASVGVDDAIPELLALGPLRKQARKQHSSVATASAPASRILPSMSSCPDCF